MIIQEFELSFFDTSIYDDLRDSVMYLNLKKAILQNPNWKILTLSGNIHNMLKPFRAEKKMALFLLEDPELGLKDKICSIYHRFSEGEMLNNRGNGLELREVSNYNSNYGVPYEKYFSFLQSGSEEPYTAFFFTKKVTAVVLVETDNH